VKILLLNENPVVTRLVTLSAQKTSDELDIIADIQDLKLQNYDLFAVDDTLYTQEIFDEVKEKVNFSNSLYLCSRDAETVEGFTETLRKPFLPTALVELFAKLDNTQEDTEIIQYEIDLTEPLENEVSTQDDGELLDLGGDEDDIGDIDLDDANELGSLDELDRVDDVEDIQLEVEQEEDDELDDLNDEDVNEEDLSEKIADETGDKSESILDKDEVQEVQNLLKETEIDDELDDLEDADDLSLGDLDDLELDNVEKSPEQESAIQENKEEKSEEADELSLDNLDELEDLDFEEEETQEAKEELADELDIETDQEAMIEELEENDTIEYDGSVKQEELTQEDELNIRDISDDDLESTIEDAVLGLSKEDLESELDEDVLMDIDISDIDGLESLNTRDIKLAIGEKVEEEIEKESQELAVPQDTEISSGKGVKSLKKLLKALSDKDVVASLKGMKININITLSDK